MQWLENHWTILTAVAMAIGQFVYMKIKLEDLMNGQTELKSRLKSNEDELVKVKLEAVREQQKVANMDEKLDEVHETVHKVYDLLIDLKRSSRTGA